MKKKMKGPVSSSDYLGFRMYWPHIVVVASFIRNNERFPISPKNVEADFLRLEFILEESLIKLDRKQGMEILKFFNSIDFKPDKILYPSIEFIVSEMAKTKKGPARLKEFWKRLNLLDSSSSVHLAFTMQMEEISKKDGEDIRKIGFDYDLAEKDW